MTEVFECLRELATDGLKARHSSQIVNRYAKCQ